MLRFTLKKTVCETDRYSESMLAGIFPIGPDRQYILSCQAFYIWRFFSMMQPQKIMTGIIDKKTPLTRTLRLMIRRAADFIF